MDIEYPTLAQRSIGGRPLLDCPHVGISENMRLWYVPRGETKRDGFSFFVGLFVSATSDGEEAWEEKSKDLMGHPDTQVECIFHGSALFDGVRHLYMGDDTEHEGHEGYVYYPDLSDMTCALAALATLELQLCWYVREEKP